MVDGKVNIQERLKQMEEERQMKIKEPMHWTDEEVKQLTENKQPTIIKVTADDIRKDGISISGIPYSDYFDGDYRKAIHDKLRVVTKMDENAPIYIGTHPVDLLPTVHPDLLCYDLFCEIINYDKDICDIITLDTNEGKEFRKQITDMGLIQLAIYKVLKG